MTVRYNLNLPVFDGGQQAAGTTVIPTSSDMNYGGTPTGMPQTGRYYGPNSQFQGGNSFTTPWSQMNAYGKLQTIGAGASAVSSLANLYLGFKGLSMQKRQNRFQRKAFNRNMANSVQDYENQLRDRYTRLSNQANIEGRTMAQDLESFLADRRLEG